MSVWKEIRLKELIAAVGDGGTPSTADPDNFGPGIPWATVEDVVPRIRKTSQSLTEKGFHSCSAKKWPAGSIILTTGATIGEVGISEIEICTKQGITGIVVNQHADTLFLRFWLENNKNLLLRFAQGTTFKEIRTRSLGNLRISVPEPFTERGVKLQGAIGRALSSLEGATFATRRSIEKAERLKRALMQNLLTGKIKPDGTWRKPEEFWDHPKAGRVPKGWHANPLKLLAQIQRGKFSARPRSDPRYYGGDYPFIQTADVSSSNGYITCYSQTLNNEGAAISRKFPVGTVFITIVGANVASTAIASFEVHTTDSVIGMIPNENVTSEYLEFYLRSSRTKLACLAGDSARENLNYGILRPFMIIHPDSTDEQGAITKMISGCESLQAAKNKKITALERLKKSLMQNLLTGKVTLKT